MAYNALNQLTRANISGPQGASVIDYAYDHDGIRIGKTINGTDVTTYVVDKNRPYAQVLGEEHLNGGLSDRYSYDAYGMLTGSSGTSANPYRYRGEQYDSDLESYYLRARYYQPGTGRFLATDPFEGISVEPPSLHRYFYANANPLSFIDPSGEMNMLEMTAVGSIISAITLPVASHHSKTLQNVYATLGQDFFPDAYMVGISLDKYARKILKIILSTVGGSNPLSLPNIAKYVTDYTAKAGVEFVLNVSSAEIGCFLYGGMSTPDLWKNNLMPTSVLTSGVVFNLYNTYDYRGPFITFTGGDYSIFSGTAFVKGAWGISKSVAFPQHTKNYSILSGSATWFFRWDNIQSDSEYKVAALAGILAITIDTATSKVKNPCKIAIEASLWTHLATSKYWWNKTRADYDIHIRQLPEQERPDGFQSGPGMLILGYYYN